MDVVDAERVVMAGLMPLHEQADEYRDAPEQVAAYAGGSLVPGCVMGVQAGLCRGAMLITSLLALAPDVTVTVEVAVDVMTVLRSVSFELLSKCEESRLTMGMV